MLSKLAPLGQTVISIPKESQWFSASWWIAARVGKEGCDERRGEERERERERKRKKWKRNGKIGEMIDYADFGCSLIDLN